MQILNKINKNFFKSITFDPCKLFIIQSPENIFVCCKILNPLNFNYLFLLCGMVFWYVIRWVYCRPGFKSRQDILFWFSFDFWILLMFRMWKRSKRNNNTNKSEELINWLEFTRALVTFMIDHHGYDASSKT